MACCSSSFLPVHSHPWTWLNSGDITIFKMFSHIFQLQHHLGSDFYKWKICFKLSYIDFGAIMYHFHRFWWPNLKKCLPVWSKDRSLWKESTKNLLVCDPYVLDLCFSICVTLYYSTRICTYKKFHWVLCLYVETSLDYSD